MMFKRMATLGCSLENDDSNLSIIMNMNILSLLYYAAVFETILMIRTLINVVMR